MDGYVEASVWFLPVYAVISLPLLKFLCTSRCREHAYPQGDLVSTAIYRNEKHVVLGTTGTASVIAGFRTDIQVEIVTASSNSTLVSRDFKDFSGFKIFQNSSIHTDGI